MVSQNKLVHAIACRGCVKRSVTTTFARKMIDASHSEAYAIPYVTEV
jgi:hypothetical protein